MAIDKTSSPGWVKAVIIFVAFTFVASVAGIAYVGASGSRKGSSGGDDANQTIAAKYQPRIDAIVAAVQADPQNPDLLAQAGHTYYEYAAELTNAGLVDAAAPLWAVAISYYERVLERRPDDAVVLGNRAFAAYYSGNPIAREALQAFIATNDAALSQQIETAKQYLASLPPAAGEATASVPATQ